MRVYVLGDSISIHYGPYLQRHLSGVMDYSRKEDEEEALLNLDNPQGANGGDSSHVLAFLKAKAASGRIDADVLLLNCGLHDLRTDPATGTKQVPLVRYQENLRSIVQLVRTMKLELIWIRTTPFDEDLHNRRCDEFHRFAADGTAYNRAADRIMAEAGVPAIDLYSFTLNLGPDLYCDHVHFHEPIREKQGEFIAGWLTSWQANRARPAVGP
jgi:lysophospholipase L1-like esterase